MADGPRFRQFLVPFQGVRYSIQICIAAVQHGGFSLRQKGLSFGHRE
jgi:hypothetical protein